MMDATAQSTYQRASQPENFIRANNGIPQNAAASPSYQELWSTRPSQPNVSSQTNEYYQKSQAYGSANQYNSPNVLQTTALFHERENKLEKVRFFCDQIKAITLDPSTVFDWNVERYTVLTAAANQLLNSIENLPKTQPPQTNVAVNQPYTAKQTSNLQNNQQPYNNSNNNNTNIPVVNPPMNQQRSVSRDFNTINPNTISNNPNGNPNLATNNFRAQQNSYPSQPQQQQQQQQILSNNSFDTFYQQSPQTLHPDMLQLPPDTQMYQNPGNNHNQNDPVDPKSSMMASFPPAKTTYEMVWTNQDHSKRRPTKKRKIKDDLS